MSDLGREVIANTPLRLSDVKASIFGGIKFGRNLYAGWDFQPSIGILVKDIDRLGLDIRSFKEPLTRAIRKVMMPSIRKNFESEGRPDNWDPLSPYTVAIRKSAHPILKRTGALKRAASSFSIWTIDQTTASVRALPSQVWYGNVHQEGYGSLMNVARKELGPKAHPKAVQDRAKQLLISGRSVAQQSKIVIPQRQFIVLQDEDEEAIQDVFIEWLEERVAKVGRFG